MIRVSGTATVFKKDIRPSASGGYFLKVTLLSDGSHYFASKRIQDMADARGIPEGAEVTFEGKWVINKSRQRDGSWRFFNNIDLDRLEFKQC